MEPVHHTPAQPLRFLNSREFAQRIGITPSALASYIHKGLTPEPDAYIGKTKGWATETIDRWQRNRPGPGRRTDLKKIIDGTTTP